MARIITLVLFVLALAGARMGAGFVVEYQWWREIGQVDTWLQMLSYGVVPVAGAALVAFVVLWLAHARALKLAGTGLREHPLYAKLTTLALLALAALLASATVDSWTVVRWAGSRTLPASSWHDPVFGHPLSFYFFDLPFWHQALGYVLALSVMAALLHWLAARLWTLRSSFSVAGMGDGMMIDPREILGSVPSALLRGLAAVFLLGLAVRFFLGRYDLLLEDHGSLVGVDWVAENWALPLAWLNIVAAVLAAAAVLARRARVAFVLAPTLLLSMVVPPLVTAVYVRPSEITIQKPYINRHIQATRTAYGLSGKVRETDFAARLEGSIDLTRHQALLDNVRLWDWRAFHDTVTQIQALRPYYVFKDSDVDRYMIDGQLRQILLTPREIDVTQLPADARSRWINPHFIYTHGYGLVAAEAARITSDGLPRLLVQDAPPQIKTASLKLTRPELYYGELSHEPVFVHTRQPEFNYPSGEQNVETSYAGKGGILVSSLFMRLCAAVAQGDWNILLTSYLGPDSRMMIHRKVAERLAKVAEFIVWDNDPYLVMTASGRLVWMADGYTTSDAHPYARAYNVSGAGAVNYIRNSVKATIDAYDGTIRLYVFDDQDPILASYRQLFPQLFTPASKMPAELRQHVRYPELIFRVQAEVYRTYHMTNPEAFFNKEDQWDLARNLNGQDGRPEPANPTYIVAALPGSDVPEFLLMTTFTPRNKDNLIGLMVARCDGEALGELHFLQLSKQELIFGPMQVEARINQDQTISKDLSLWNQRGSQVLRGQMLVLPVENTLLYIEPIYIQASEARMPQLKKVVIAMGNRTVYADTYEQALAELSGISPQPAQPAAGSKAAPAPAPAAQTVLGEIGAHLRRYRELMGQGRYAEAGREIESVERLSSTSGTPKARN